MALSIAREIAYDAFVMVHAEKRSADYALEQKYDSSKKSLKRVDRNLAKQLLYGSLRWHQKIEWIVQNISSRDLQTLEPPVYAALILGTYQVFYMDRIPDRAAVNESVEYVKSRGFHNAKTFVNGIMRQVARKSLYFPKPDKVEFPVKYLALQYSHPNWLVSKWYKTFKPKRVEEILISNNQPPPISIRLNTMKHTIEKSHEIQHRLLKEEGAKSDRRPLRSCFHLKNFPSIEEKSLFAEGAFTIQDEAAQLVSLLMDIQPEDRVLDACCGPAGKLAHLYELSEGKAKLIGFDTNPDQLERARQNIDRLGHDPIRVEERDFLEWTPQEDFRPNKILLDAPCSGFGVLRRHPEGKMHKDVHTIQRHAKIQRSLLKHAIECLPKGGRMVYSVCSFEIEELLDHFEWILEQYPDTITVESPLPMLPNYYKKYVTRRNIFLVISGNQEQMDGFSAFILTKQ